LNASGATALVAQLEDRGINQTAVDQATLDLLGVDVTNGDLYIRVGSTWVGSGTPPCSPVSEIVRLHGLGSLFEIEQTYQPATQSLSFRVPARPEGLAGADHFDTFWGMLGHPIEFTQAQPLQCHYPSTPPVAGQLLSVPVSLPDPPTGQA
jgi:hypothetical protein